METDLIKQMTSNVSESRGSGPQLQIIVDSTKAFLDAESTVTADVETIVRSLDARPLMAQVPHLLPAEEVDIRLELAAKIRDLQFSNGEDHLTAFDVSLIMFVPIHTVRRWSVEIDSGASDRDRLLGLVRICMSHP